MDDLDEHTCPVYPNVVQHVIHYKASNEFRSVENAVLTIIFMKVQK